MGERESDQWRREGTASLQRSLTGGPGPGPGRPGRPREAQGGAPGSLRAAERLAPGENECENV